jgi:hypothetical protein
MNTTFSFLTAVVLLAALVWAVVRIIGGDRPANPPSSFQDDWREEQLAWRHLGIH